MLATDFLSADDVHLLTEVGMVGVGMRLHVSALALFEALTVLRPARDFPWIGQASVWLNRGQADEAVRVLEQACSQLQVKGAGPTEDLTMLMAFLGFAQHMARRTAESQQTLRAVLAMPPHAHAHAIAKDMLGLTAQPPLFSPVHEPMT